MIWSIVSKEEMEGFGISHVFEHYQKALGEDNIKLAVVEEDDPLDFIEQGDIVILRTASSSLVDTILSKKCRTTAETFYLYDLTNDKLCMAEMMMSMGIDVPFSYRLEQVKDGKAYFVKPRYGSDSKGISNDCICRSVSEVNTQVARFGDSVIEDFIDGKEYTMSCAIIAGKILTASVRVKTDEYCGIQTQEIKNGTKKWVYETEETQAKKMQEICEKIIKALDIKHHVRIDFREDNEGRLYPIDVNLLPGMGPIGFWHLCWASKEGFSYKSSIKLLVNTAS